MCEDVQDVHVLAAWPLVLGCVERMCEGGAGEGIRRSLGRV